KQGESLMPILEAMYEWGKNYIETNFSKDDE
ncbi:winged helix-turn-helix transcriptional regulator, partial [Bacillus paralicheniformis]